VVRDFLYELFLQVLILDKPSSSLYPVSEKEVFESFFDATKEKIEVFTSYRFCTVKFASNNNNNNNMF
jgi:ABC-type multidrug transport system fused ATPase/permease subunit